MKEQTSLWEYVEGRCNRTEKADFEARLGADPTLRHELALVRRLHLALSNCPPERAGEDLIEKGMMQVNETAQVQPLVDSHNLRRFRVFWLVLMCLPVLLSGSIACPENVPFTGGLDLGVKLWTSPPAQAVMFSFTVVGLLAALDVGLPALFHKWLHVA